MRRDEATLDDIGRAARSAMSFIEGMEKGEFLGDEKSQSAVLHQLLVLGEAVKRLSMEFRDANPGVPWSLIAGMRDQLIHAYDVVDLDEVWSTVKRDLPELLRSLSKDR